MEKFMVKPPPQPPNCKPGPSNPLFKCMEMRCFEECHQKTAECSWGELTALQSLNENDLHPLSKTLAGPHFWPSDFSFH